MKRKSPCIRLSIIVLACAVLLPASTSFARWDTSYPPDGDHPLRIAHYFVYPIGKFLEMTVTRPMAAVGNVVAPYEHIDERAYTGCSRERPARSCTEVIK